MTEDRSSPDARDPDPGRGVLRSPSQPEKPALVEMTDAVGRPFKAYARVFSLLGEFVALDRAERMGLTPEQREAVSAYYDAKCRFETARMNLNRGEPVADLGELGTAAGKEALAGYCSAMKSLEAADEKVRAFMEGSGPFERASEPSAPPVTPASVFGPEKVPPGGPFDPQAFAEATRLLLEATSYLDRLVHLTRRADDGGG